MPERNRYHENKTSGEVSALSASATALALLLLLFLLPLQSLMAQDEPLYDEIAIYLRVPYIGVSEIEALIRDESAWLPVTELFDFLKIKNTPSDDHRTVSGFFIDPAAEYIIDRNRNSITYNGKSWQLNEGDIIITETALFLKSEWFGKVFGVNCNFSFRDLTVSLETQHELPGIRELRLLEMRKNLNRLSGEITVDTTIGRRYHPFRFGMADWSLYSSQRPGAGSQARMNLALGAMVAGGEATASLNYYTDQPFSSRHQTYLWRYVNNDNPFVRQVMAGKINAGATSTLYNHVIGAQITNTPTTFRRSYGTYTLTDKTEPDWTVELYINGVLVDYVKADASGFFSFDVPLIYGNTSIRLKFYGPWGEEREREQNITIPYNFLPVKEFEYTLSAGVVEDSSWSRFSRASMHWGATRFLTLGGGAEYLSSVSPRPFMPFIDASVRLTNSIMLSGVYTYGVKASGALSWRLPANMQLDLDYAWYHPDQQAINFHYLEERKASLSIPVRLKKSGAFTRLSYYRVALANSHYTTAEWLLSGSFRRVSASLSTYSRFMERVDPNIYSNLSLIIRLPGELLFTPQVQYSYTKGELLTAKAGLERRVFRNGYATVSYEQNFINNIRMGEVGMRYDFSFMQAGVSARQINRQPMFVEYARGSLVNDTKTRFLRGDNRTNVGRAGITVLAYLDINANGTHDEGEPRVGGLRVRTNGGSVNTLQKDTTIRITGLEPYVRYFIELDDSGIENIAWRVEKKTMAVITDPNVMKLIEVPVKVMGEAAGTVALEEGGKTAGLGRIIVRFRNRATGTVYNALTEPDGYFSYFGLAPGSYSVRVDTAQLRRIGMSSEPDSIAFDVRKSAEGDYIDGLDFILRKVAEPVKPATPPVTGPEADSVRMAPPPERPGRDTTYIVIHEVTRELVEITEDYYAVQFGAFTTKLYAEIMRDKVAKALDKNVELFEEDGFWKVRITGFDDREDLESYIPVIHAQDITEIWVITNKAVSGEWITKRRDDSLAVVRDQLRDVVPVAEEKPAKDKVVEGKPAKEEALEAEAEPADVEPLPLVITGTSLQLGAFTSYAESQAMADRLLAAADRLVTIRNEGGRFKVRITGFADTTEVREFLPVLEEHGITQLIFLDEWGNEMAPPEPPVVIPPVVLEEKAAVPEPVRDEPEEAAPAKLQLPRFVLHAGSYYRKAEAERAAQRIKRRLNLNAEIVEEWESYRVVISGFFTREETYPLYPELAGLGFTDIFVYEKPLTER